jgi:hypothetical protein
MQGMTRFLDVHSMKGLDENTLKEIQKAPIDEFGVLHLNILYNPEVDRCFCLIEARTMEAVQKYHQKVGLKCDWITEVKTTA